MLACATLARAARADALTASESTRLERGETVVREKSFDPPRGRYVGGVTYTIIDATAAEILRILDDVGAYLHVLPRTKRARLVGVAPSGDRFVELVQGNALVEAEYTLRLRRDDREPSRREVKFWLEPSRPHEIDDAWGFFRVEPFYGPRGEERVLFTYAVLVDIGPGIVRELFEARVQAALLSVPQRVRRYAAEAKPDPARP